MNPRDIFLKNLADLVEKHCGINLSEEKISLYLTSIFQISPKLSKLNYYEYLQLLEMSNPSDEPEWKNVFTALKISETYFFRDKSQLDFLQNVLLNQIISQKERQKDITLWSAGCSTGEETYTLAFLSKLQWKDLDFRVRILGSDINENSIQIAKNAKYPAWSLRSVPESERRFFFQGISDIWEVRPEFRKLVDFRLENLLKVPYLDEFDLILCRNVFIYLNEETKKSILEKFANALKPGGFLVLGHSEAGGVIPDSLQENHHSSFLYYSKKTKPSFSFPTFNTKVADIIQEKRVPIPSPKLSLQVAIDLANQGNLPGAKEYCLKIIKEDDKNFEATHWLGHIFEAEGDYLSAEMYYTKAMNLNHEFLENYISLSSLYTVLGRDMESEKLKSICKKILFERIDLQTSYSKKGLDLKRLKNYLESEKEIWVT
jgi:chemotaxis protein methyltransferase CheR